jgi:peptide/nickel transport system permease protein
MTWYLVRRVGQAIAVVIGVMILTFVLAHLEPGSTARAILGLKATPERVAAFNTTYGLNKPLLEQFFSYVHQLVHGNLGVSYQLQQPVSTLIAQRMPRDALLLGISLVLSLLIAVPMGIYQAVRRDGLADDLLSGTTFTLYAMPDFWLALMLIAVFCVQLHVFPPAFPGGVTSVAGILADPRALVLPVAVLTLNNVSSFSRYMRSAAIEELAQDYIRMVRAKGLPERLVLSRHLLRNAILPIITILGLSVPGIVAGAVIAEMIFNFPGMGLLFYQAALAHDFPILLGATLIVGIATVIGNLAADVAYGVVDPRIRHGNT